MIGNRIDFEVITEHGVQTEVARVTDIQFTKFGPVFIGVTPFGNQVRLTRREISNVICKKKK